MDFFHAFYFVSFMGSTIGFGELPYPFTDEQRLWVLICIYISVFAWLYAIGTALAMVQDPAFRYAVTQNAFARSVRRIVEPFYLVCGYGDTGQLLVQGLIARGLRAVVLDRDQDCINQLHLSNLDIFVPGLLANATDPANLLTAGLQHRRCVGVVALTDNDHVNLKIAITSKLLNPDLRVICRSEIHDVGINMESFGTDEIVNPFDLFADRLAMALHSPATYIIHQWLTSAPGTPLKEPLFPPRGQWALCGYGRFGKAVQQYLSFEGVEATIIEADPEKTNAPSDAIVGRGTEAVTLREAGIEQAVGVIAGTDDDANNLSIIMTAKELNPELFTVARQNRQENQSIFEAADLHLVMERSDIIARFVITLITNPLLAEFLRAIDTEDDENAANVLASRISGLVGETVPVTWTVETTKSASPALAIHLFQGAALTINQLRIDPTDRGTALPCIPLLLKHAGDNRLLPDGETTLAHGDRILFCGHRTAARRMSSTVVNQNSLAYVTGRPPVDGLVGWLRARSAANAQT
jgi:Trk K+ transport system NAD-binding subunit